MSPSSRTLWTVTAASPLLRRSRTKSYRLRELLRRCLERNPRERLRDIGEARIALGHPGSLVPNNYGACTIGAFGNIAFELRIIEGMVFDMYGQAFF